jgi:endonuclease G, mitochondrial
MVSTRKSKRLSQQRWQWVGLLSSLLVLASGSLTQARNFGSIHLILGTPSPASTDPANKDDYLMLKRQYALSYNNSKGTANWVSWQLNASWIGDIDRCKSFTPDTTLPTGFVRVVPNDYTSSGFSRGHMTRSLERSTNERDNCATFLMTNIVPQTQDNNAGPWLELENLSLELARSGKELYIIAGPHGVGGTGLMGKKEKIGNGKVTVPESLWKIVVVLDKPGLRKEGVTANTRVIAVNMPNVVGINDKNWKEYVTTVDELEQMTGYDFLADVPTEIQNVIEAKQDGN